MEEAFHNFNSFMSNYYAVDSTYLTFIEYAKIFLVVFVDQWLRSFLQGTYALLINLSEIN